MSFIPPDGNFRLMSYLIGAQNVVAIPLYVRHSLHLPQDGSGASGKIDITVGPKQTMGRQLEHVKVEIPMPKSVLNCTLSSTQGKYTFDPVSKILCWEVGKVDAAKLPNIKGTVNVVGGSEGGVDSANPTMNVSFTISQLAVSGLKVSRLDLYGEKYKPFKGVKYVTKAGRFQVRM